MPVSSRVNRPLPRVSTREAKTLSEFTNVTKEAVAGDGNGKVFIASQYADFHNYGQVWIRLYEGVDGSGNAVYSPPKKALADKDFYPADGMAIRVSVDMVSGKYRVQGNDVKRSAAYGVNTNGFNTQNPAHNRRYLDDLRNGSFFSPTSNTTSLTKVTQEPYLYIYNGTVKLAQKGLTDNVDLSSYIPGSNLERLVGLGIKASDNSVQIVSGSTRAVSGDAWELTDLQEIVDGFDSDTMPIDVWRLQDSQTEINQTDRLFDLRQFINMPGAGGSGYPDPVTNTFEITAGYTVLVKDGITVSSGGIIKLNSGSVMKVF